MATRLRRVAAAAHSPQQHGVRLAKDNPLCVGLVGVFAPGLFDGNLIGNSAFAAKTGTYSEVVTRDGRAWSFAGGSIRSTDIEPLGNTCTLAAIVNTDTSSAAAVLSVGNSAGSDNWHTLYHNGNANASFQSRTGGTIGDATGSVSIRFARTVLAGTVDGASLRKIFIDGVESGSNTTTVSVSGNNRPVISGLWRSGSIIQAMPSTTTVALAVISNRAWGAEEHAKFAADPWAIFERDTQVPAATAGGSPDVDVSLTGQSVTVSQGSLVASGDKSVSLTGQSVTVSQGTVTAKPYQRINITEPVSGRAATILRPYSDDGVTPMDCIIYCHGQNGPEHAPDSETDPNLLGNAFAAANMMIAGINGGNSWGNLNSLEYNVALAAYLRATYTNIRNFALWGTSMGGMVAMNVAKSGRINDIRGVLIIAGATNLADMYTVYPANIDTAFGITGTGTATYANKTRGLDPNLTDAFAMQHRRFRFVGSNSDSTVDWANNGLAMAAKLAGTCAEASTVTVTGGHISSDHYDPADALAFMQRCFDTPVALGRPASTRTISVTLKDAAGSARASLTGLTAAWFDQPTVSGLQYPTAVYTGLTTDGSGVLSLTSVPSDLAVSEPGLLLVSDTDGTTTQTPVHKIAGGPVEVS